MGFLAKMKEEFSFVRGNLLVLIVSWMFFRSSFSLVHPFESLYIRELGASPFVIGLMGSLGFIILSLVTIPGSYIADKYGRRDLIVIMTYGAAASTLFYALAPDWRFVLIGIIVHNLCLIYMPALGAIEADSIPPERRGMGFALGQILPLIPAAFFPAASGLLVDRYGIVFGMRIAYVVATSLGLTAALIRTFFLKETLSTSERISIKGLGLAFKSSIASMVEAWKSTSRNLAFLMMAMLVMAVWEPVFHTFAVLYVRDVIGISGMEWGLVRVASMVATIVVGLPLGKLVDAVGRKRPLILSQLLLASSAASFIFCRGFGQLLITFVALTSSTTLIMLAYASLRADIIPRDKRGRMMGVIGMFMMLAIVPSSALAGFLYQVDPTAPFALVIASGVMSCLIVTFFVEEPRRREV